MKEVDRSNLFVYGTLKKGGRLHSVLGSSSEFLGVFRTIEDKFDMHDYGCPIMVLENGSFKIKGELYKVTPECMARVTAVECGAGYVPFIVELEQDVKSNNMYWKKATKAIAFIYPTPYATTNVSDRVEEKDRVKEWNDG
jgi:gamma-glutamylcyclotransferase (GGCT)/AIG2-like uncharacterized protein YtfP